MPDVFMPRLSDTMSEGSISQWLKAPGDVVHRGDVLAEVETDKAVMDLEAYEDGVLEKVLVAEGQVVPIGATIAVIGDGSGSAGAEQPPAAPAESAAAAEAAAAEPAVAEPDATEPAATGVAVQANGPALPEQAAPAGGDRPKASPVVRALARTHSIDLSTITGTGPGGRIIRVDVEKVMAGAAPAGGVPEGKVPEGAPAAAVPAGATSASAAVTSAAVASAAVASAAVTSAAVAGPDDEVVPLSTIRRVTARRLTEAAAVPAFQLTTVLDASRLVEFRAEINQRLATSGTKVSVTDLLVRACAVTLRSHPQVNASFAGDSIVRHGRVHVGIAVALDDGLIVPVIKDADRKSVSEIGSAAKELAGRARAGKLTPDEFTGGTFTISNLGMFGIDSFIAVLNPPEAAILAVGATTEQAVVLDGQVVVRPTMKMTLTVDHRVLDGATAAAFLRDLTAVLAEPLRIVV